MRPSSRDPDPSALRPRAAARHSSGAVRVALLALLLGGCHGIKPEDLSEVVPPAAALLPQPEIGTDQALLPSVPHVPAAARRPDADLLARIRRQLTLPVSEDPAVQNELKWIVSHPEYLDRVFNRAGGYLYYIVEELERRHLPLDLALLPIVESAYDPFAYSHGRAAGLWQIIPGTGSRLGLKQNWWYDGRRDVLESTRAALDYLEHLHQEFDGDWLLAVAGYNSGEGNVGRARRRAADADQPGDFWHIKRYLPAETRTYVPRLLALRDVFADPQAHGVSLPSLPDAPYFAVVETGSQIDMSLAAELAGIESDALYALNPGVNRWATDPDGPHRLLVPVEAAGRLASAVAGLGERERVRWTRHQIERGETLGQLAERYRTTPAVLREVNGLRGNTIRTGDHLMVPHALQSMERYTQTAEVRVERQQSQPREGQRRTHTVQGGESLWGIARRYGVGVRELASWNAMAPGDVLSVGRQLAVWTDQPPGGQPSLGERIRRLTYVVRRGDSLYAIASRFQVSVADLVEWNSIPPNRYLQPGQQLVMFVDVTRQST